MTCFLRRLLRARRVHGLHALPTGELRPKPGTAGTIPEYLSQDLGLPEGIPHDRPVIHSGILIHTGRP